MEKEKVEGVLNWLKPKNVKNIRKFLGFTNYYRRFIKDFAVMLYRCLGKINDNLYPNNQNN